MKSNETKQKKPLKGTKRQKYRNDHLKNMDALIQKYPKEKDFFTTYCGKKAVVFTYDGMIDFDPEGYCDVIGAEKFTYYDYIDVQIRSFHKTRGYFAACYYNTTLAFAGYISNRTDEYICFNRIKVSGMYPDGICFDGKEEHVWMSNAGFEEYQIGDCVSFSAEVYRYVKTGDGKQIDYALRNPKEIKKIEPYKLPTDNDLLKQAFSEIICEECYLNEYCSKNYCILS